MRVLVVDADAEVSSLLREILTRVGYRVRSATTGADALAEIRTSPPDAVLLDLRMPRLDGWQVLQACCSDGRVPVAAMSADVDELGLAIAAGAQRHLVKPFGVSAVLQLVDEMTTAHNHSAPPQPVLA